MMTTNTPAPQSPTLSITRSTLDVFACPLTGSALIEASAGTGKTWAICGLVLRLLVEKALPINGILVVTFTNAATAELKERIRARLVEVLDCLAQPELAQGGDPFPGQLLARFRQLAISDVQIRERLQMALTGFDEAAIFTIHGFCQRALADTPFAAGQPFRQEIVEQKELCEEVGNDFWRREIAFGDLPTDLAAWVANGELRPEHFHTLLGRHLGHPLTEIRWPKETTQEEVDLTSTFLTAKAEWEAHCHDILAILLAALPNLHKASFSEEKIRQGCEELARYFAQTNPLQTLDKTASNLGQTLLAKKTGKNKTPPSHAFFEALDAVLLAQEATLARLQQETWGILQKAVAWGLLEIRRRKRERRQLSFDDLLFNLHQALHGMYGSSFAHTLRQRYPAALIDEFQDTDPLQFAIFKAIYAGHSEPWLLVGDPKQAIYSFRQADLHTYLLARGETKTHYSLQKNQRSSPELITAVNALFAAQSQPFMLPDLHFIPAELGEKPRQKFVDLSSEPRAPLQCWQLPSTEDSRLSKREAIAQAAATTAAEIARLLTAAHAGKILLGDNPPRPLHASDIAVLVRTHEQGRQIKAALAGYGIMAAELAQASVFASQEAAALQRVLYAMLEPTRPERLRAALSTEFFGWDSSKILALHDDETALAHWIAMFHLWHERWQKRGIIHALGALQNSENVPARLLALPEGERRLTNLRHLGELLHHAEHEHHSPEALLLWFMAQCKDPEQGEVAQLRLESDQQLVSIVTIHKSKGLEYAITFCPFIWEWVRRPVPRGGLPCVQYHDADGKAILDYNTDDVAANAKAEAERAAELLRLLYVALTRAEHRAYVICGPYHVASGRGVSDKESRRALLNWLVAGEGITPEQWLAGDTAQSQILHAWQALATTAKTVISLTPLPSLEIAPLHDRNAPPHFQASRFSRQLQVSWRMESFSSLMRGAVHDAYNSQGSHDKYDSDDSHDKHQIGGAHEGGATDHDAYSSNDVGNASSASHSGMTGIAPSAAIDILAFPRGAQAGECIHYVFEHAEFTDPNTWEEAISGALTAFPPSSDILPNDLAAMLRQMLHDVLNTPIPHPSANMPICLGQIQSNARIAEMEFTLHSPDFDLPALQALLDKHGMAIPQLALDHVHGWLRGFMDLVFVWEGKFYVLDWKSNYLGANLADYHQSAMAEAMFSHGYTLQSLIYCIALHRYLEQRLPNYDPATHLGGSVYLFIRGVRPNTGTQGMYVWQPDWELLQASNALLGKGKAEKKNTD